MDIVRESKNWLLIGVVKNWETALSQPVPLWGLKQQYSYEFQAMQPGDIVWFYATRPVSGVIGIGKVKDKYIDSVNLTWEEEIRQKKVVWPLRFRIQVLKVLPLAQWKTSCVNIKDFGLFWQQGFQLLKSEHVAELFKRAEEVFGHLSAEIIYTGPTIAYTESHIREAAEDYQESGVCGGLSHRQAQECLAEIGKLQFYYSEIEYPLELPGERKSLDVVWKREIDGVPTFAFEVEFSGMIERAIERLKFAFKKWNSQPRLVLKEDFLSKAYNLMSMSDREFSAQLKIYEPTQVVKLLKKKRDLKELEQQLNLY